MFNNFFTVIFKVKNFYVMKSKFAKYSIQGVSELID